MEKKVIRNRPSAVRDKIMETLLEKREALAHKDFQRIFEDKWDRVTIYRALEKLVEEGRIHKVTGVDSNVQFALCTKCEVHVHRHDHVHFHCLKCHKVTCMETLIPSFDFPEGFVISTIQCVVSGVCQTCQNAA